VDDADLHAFPAQVGGDPIGTPLGADETQTALGALMMEAATVGLVHLVDRKKRCSILHVGVSDSTSWWTGFFQILLDEVVTSPSERGENSIACGWP